MLRLLITDASGQRRLECDRPEVVIGRRLGVDVQIHDPAASGNHCVLRVNGRRAQLIDLGSTNGLTVDGERQTEASLKPGDEFRIGHTVIRVEGVGLMIDEPPPPIAAKAPGGLVAAGTPQDFGRELRTALARTPWYMASLVCHVLAIWILAHVPFSIKTPSTPSRIAAVTPNDLADVDNSLDDVEPELPERLPEVIDDELDEDPQETRPNTAEAEFTEDDYTQDQPDIGTGKALTLKISPLNVKSNTTSAGTSVDKGNLKNEHGVAKKSVERGMGGALRSIRGKADKRLIVVIKGDFDKIENVLDLYKIAYTLVERDAFQRRSYPKARVICANCARKPSNKHEAKRLAAKIERFVRNGGWFISSDWALEPYVTRSWPEVVKVVSPKRRQGDTTVTVERVGMSPLVAKAFGRASQTRWWLEETSTFFEVSRRANVLVKSEQMREKYGAGTVAFEYTSGKGRGIHLLGHFWQEDGNRAGLVAMHTVIINFLYERFR